MVETFGQQTVQEVFGLRLATAHLRRLRKLEIAHTEEYALLCILLGLDAENPFSDQVIPLHLQEQMKTLAKQDRQYTKQGIAEQLVTQIGLCFQNSDISKIAGNHPEDFPAFPGVNTADLTETMLLYGQATAQKSQGNLYFLPRPLRQNDRYKIRAS